MKKLSIEEKAEAYDKAIERAVNIRTGKCETTFIFTEGLFDYLFPELEECNEEEVRKAMIDFFKHEREEGVVVSHYGVNIERMIAWLEKQGQTFTKKGVDDAYLAGVRDAKQELEKQGEQKPADKVEPKFHIGDWIVTSYGKVSQVIAVDEDGDGFTLDDDTYFSGSWKDDYHLWAIQDAKDGDILAEDSCIFIIKKLNPNGTAIVHCCLFDDGEIDLTRSLTLGFDVDSTHPANKEQQDTLFAKMKEAGYEWDAEKKELKKISQRMISAEAKEAMYGNSAWSEEDKKMCQETIDWFEKKCFPYALESENPARESIKWLKSLKQRYTWKPSEIQLQCLYDAIEHYQTNGYPASKLTELYEQMSYIYKL